MAIGEDISRFGNDNNAAAIEQEVHNYRNWNSAETDNKYRTASKGVAQRPREIDYYYDSLINSSSSTTNNIKERTPCLSPE